MIHPSYDQSQPTKMKIVNYQSINFYACTHIIFAWLNQNLSLFRDLTRLNKKSKVPSAQMHPTKHFFLTFILGKASIKNTYQLRTCPQSSDPPPVQQKLYFCRHREISFRYGYQQTPNCLKRMIPLSNTITLSYEIISLPSFSPNCQPLPTWAGASNSGSTLTPRTSRNTKNIKIWEEQNNGTRFISQRYLS